VLAQGRAELILGVGEPAEPLQEVGQLVPDRQEQSHAFIPPGLEVTEPRAERALCVGGAARGLDAAAEVERDALIRAISFGRRFVYMDQLTQALERRFLVIVAFRRQRGGRDLGGDLLEASEPGEREREVLGCRGAELRGGSLQT
jgi:hypothetical protein